MSQVANVQTGLPSNLANRVAQHQEPAPQPQVQAPALPTQQPAPVDLLPAAQPQQPPAQAPAIQQPAPLNPMGLDAYNGKDAVPPQPQAPAQPQQPATQQPASQPAPSGSVAELAGHMAQDSNVKVAVEYMDVVLKDAGVDIQRALGNATDELDARFIDVHYLKEKLGDKADQVIKLATSTIEYARDYQAESVKQVREQAGGEQQWNAAVQVFNEKADPQERAMLADLLNSGVRDKMLYAAKKVAEFGVNAGAVIRHNAPPMGQPGSMQGLSKEAYVKAISERNLSPEKYEQLKAQRRLGMQQGL